MNRKLKLLITVFLIVAVLTPLCVYAVINRSIRTSPLLSWTGTHAHPELESQLLSQGYFIVHDALVFTNDSNGEGTDVDIMQSDVVKQDGNGGTLSFNGQVWQYYASPAGTTERYYPGEAGQLPYDFECYDWKFVHRGGTDMVMNAGTNTWPGYLNLAAKPLFDLSDLPNGWIRLKKPKNGTTTSCIQVFAKFIGRVPGATHVSVATIDSDSATWTGNIYDIGLPGITQAGYVYSTNSNPATLVRGTAAELAVSKTTTGVFAVQVDGLLSGVTYYIRPFGTNIVGTGYGPVTAFTLNLPPTITKTSPAASSVYIGGGGIIYNYTLLDREGANLTNTLTIKDAGTGTTLFSGTPNTTNNNTQARHVFNPSTLALTWNAGNNRYEKTLSTTLTSYDGEKTGTNTSTVTVYNNKPQFTLSTNMVLINMSNSEAFSFKGKAWDADQGKVTIKATISGNQAQNILNPSPSSVPGTDNFTLNYAALPIGSYTGIIISLDDDYGGHAEMVWTGTVAVTDVLQAVLNGLSASDYKDTDMYFVAGNTGIPISKTPGNDATISKINAKKTDLDTELALIGQSGSQGYLAGNPADEYIVSDPNRTSNLIDYLGRSLTTYGLNNSGVFNTGDFISASIKFMDTENDYQDIPNAQKIIKYDTLEDVWKKYRTGSLKLSYQHDPDFFDNPVPKHAADTGGQLINVTGPTDPAFITQATDAMAGRWTMKLSAFDWTNTGGVHDKETDPYEVSFICNRIPNAILNMNEDQNNFYLDASLSYDLDKQYSLPDNGIVKYEWYYLLSDNTWHKSPSGSKTLTLPKNIGGLQPTRYGVTVFDNYNAKDSTLDDVDLSLIANLSVDKPYPQKLKYGETFKATFVITTDETINSVTSRVDAWAPSRSMTFKTKVGNVSTYECTFTVANGIVDKMYFVYANVKTAEGHDETRFARINVENNRPPDHDSVTVSPVNAYTGDTLATAIQFHDPDGDVLTHHVVLTRGGTTVYDQTHTVTPGGLIYSPQNLTLLNNAPAGNYQLTSVITDPYGELDTYTVSFVVSKFIFTGEMLPADPMAGDELIFKAHTEGGIDGFQLLLDSAIPDNDQREAMGYSAAAYPVTWTANGSVDSKDSDLRYILWCTTPQTITLKGVRNRDAYTFTLRAYIGSVYRDLTFIRDVSGDVRQLIKTQ